MSKVMSQETPSNEKLLTGLAYLLGLIPALIIWSLNKDDDRALRFHALQAALYDGIVSIIVIGMLILSVGMTAILMIAVWLGTNMIADLAAPETPLIYLILAAVMMLSITGWVGLAVLLILCLSLLDLIAAIFVFAGKNWRYPVIAKWAEKLLHRVPVSH